MVRSVCFFSPFFPLIRCELYINEENVAQPNTDTGGSYKANSYQRNDFSPNLGPSQRSARRNPELVVWFLP